MRCPASCLTLVCTFTGRTSAEPAILKPRAKIRNIQETTKKNCGYFRKRPQFRQILNKVQKKKIMKDK